MYTRITSIIFNDISATGTQLATNNTLTTKGAEEHNTQQSAHNISKAHGTQHTTHS
jgi:hypothetical protein